MLGHSSLVECWSCGQIQSQMNILVICVVRLHFAHTILKHLAMSMDIASYDDMCTHQHSILMILCVPGSIADLHSWLASPKDILDDLPLCEWVAAQVIEQTHTIATADCNNPTRGHPDQVWGCYIAKENLHMLPGSCCLLVQHMNGWPFIWNLYRRCSPNVRSNKTHHMIGGNSFDLFSEDSSTMYIFASS